MITENQVKMYFKQKGFKILSCSIKENKATIEVQKDYSRGFNISFDGSVELKVTVFLDMHKKLWAGTYPTFKEITSKIPKEAHNHIYNNGNICYAPIQRPLKEKWKLANFIDAVDAMINNFFSIVYIGKGTLFELEHGQLGLDQYDIISEM